MFQKLFWKEQNGQTPQASLEFFPKSHSFRQELELMQASDVLAKLPEGLIQELIHMMEEGLPGEPGSGESQDFSMFSGGRMAFVWEHSQGP